MKAIHCAIASIFALNFAVHTTAIAGVTQHKSLAAGPELIVTRCVKCHGEKTRLGGLDLRTIASMLKGGAGGPALTAGIAEKSLLYKRVFDHSMPPAGEPRMSGKEIAAIRDWIKSLASESSNPSSIAHRPSSDHWAFKAPILPRFPAVKNQWWVRSPIDAFILAKLEAKGIRPPVIADRRTLIRRLSLDLLGLPPSPEETARFLADRSPNSYEKLVDDMLARPQYGERWARHWLDAARYAESNGYERDGAKPCAWRYRDYVIKSLNDDKPYDRFVTEQIAGDELPDSYAETQIGTTFLRLGTWDDEPAEPMLDRYDQLDDVLGTTSAVFMAQTLRCARCHDHKFEPFTQKDYYQLLSVFMPLKRPLFERIETDWPVGTGAEVDTYLRETAKADKEVDLVRDRLEPLILPLRNRLLDSKKLRFTDEVLGAFRTPRDTRNPDQKELVRRNQAEVENAAWSAANMDECSKIEPLLKQIARFDAARPKELPRGYIWYENGPKAPDTRILQRGDPTRSGEAVQPKLPTVLAFSLSPPIPTAKSTGRRLWLANWLTRKDNPLTARVMVNRVWQGHFGRGLVSTTNDFGIMGARPSHPELLDWLAGEFVRPSMDVWKHGSIDIKAVGDNLHTSKPPHFQTAWSLKRLHRLILMSNTYKAASAARPDAIRNDPENVLLSRWKPRRLEAEVIRDSMLSASGRLNLEIGGPSIYPKLPPEVLAGQSRPGDGWPTSSDRDSCRRSVYVFVKRSLAVPELEVLDSPDTTSSCEARVTSTVAPQALTFLNGEFSREQAKSLAARLVKEAGADPVKQIARAFELTLCRPPQPDEIRYTREFTDSNRKQVERDALAHGIVSTDARERALEALCLVMLNTNEFFYIQ